jgi:hypothetical protein
MLIMSERPTRGPTATVLLNKALVLRAEKRLAKSPLETSIG